MTANLNATTICHNASVAMKDFVAVYTSPVPGGVLAQLGTLEVRLARSEAEIASAQEVRYQVFVGEMGARAQGAAGQRDIDRYDVVCDHLVVLDHALGGEEHRKIVGTYRLLRQDRAAASGGFYSSGEFDIDRLIGRHRDRRFLELGRSCVLPQYRQRRTLELLWQGIWAYCDAHNIGAMIGCASFPGTVPAAHAEALSFLVHNFPANGPWAVSARPERYRPLDMMPREAIDAKSAIAAMPPLVKGYLRVGAMFGNGCVVDHDFRTTDVFVVLPLERIGERYINHYGRGPLDRLS